MNQNCGYPPLAAFTSSQALFHSDSVVHPRIRATTSASLVKS